MATSPQASARFSSSDKSAIVFIHLRSAPALKHFPIPARTITRISRLSVSSRKLLSSAFTRVSLNALDTPGRVSRIVARRPLIATFSVCHFIENLSLGVLLIAELLHPKKSEFRVGNRRIQSGRYTEPENPPRI